MRKYTVNFLDSTNSRAVIATNVILSPEGFLVFLGPLDDKGDCVAVDLVRSSCVDNVSSEEISTD